MTLAQVATAAWERNVRTASPRYLAPVSGSKRKCRDCGRFVGKASERCRKCSGSRMGKARIKL